MPLFEFSEYVRDRADTLGISMAELARRSGISRQALYGILDGSSGQAKVSTLISLASALQVHPVVLFRHLLHQWELPKFSTTGAKYQFDASGFVAETVPDHTTVTTGQTFCKTWEIQNIGHVTWQNRKLRCVDQTADIPNLIDGILPPSSERCLIPSHMSLDIPETLPGDTVLLSVQFKAPSYPCSIISYWKMTDEHGDICFPETEGLSCLVRVVSM